MEKREDCWWRESTLGEDVDVKVGTYLRANHQEYQEIRHQIDELIQQYPAVRALFESEDAVTLTAEEHKALIRYFCLESSVEMIEREYHFYMCHRAKKLRKKCANSEARERRKMAHMFYDSLHGM